MVGLYRVWRTIEDDTLPEIDLNPKKFFGGDNWHSEVITGNIRCRYFMGSPRSIAKSAHMYVLLYNQSGVDLSELSELPTSMTGGPVSHDRSTIQKDLGQEALGF